MAQKSYNQLGIGIKKLKKHGLAMAAFWILVALYAFALFAGFLAPYHYDNEQRTLSYAPPTKIYFTDDEGGLTRPFVYKSDFEFDEFYNRVYSEDKSKKYES